MNAEDLAPLGALWDMPDGALYKLRNRDWSAENAAEILRVLDAVPSVADEELIPRELAQLLWLIPVSIGYQMDWAVDDPTALATLEVLHTKATENVGRILSWP